MNNMTNKANTQAQSFSEFLIEYESLVLTGDSDSCDKAIELARKQAEAIEGMKTALKRAYHALPLESKTREAIKAALDDCGVDVGGLYE
jgi:hypothetical protein